MNFSYWENKNWFENVDFTIVGSGIVGISCALNLRKKYPESKIIILEKGFLPEGASTKNAGFACFGSLSEIIDDLKTHSENEVFELVEKRWKGLQFLRNTIGDAILDYKSFGGYEVFLNKDQAIFESCVEKMPFINQFLEPIFKAPVFEKQIDRFGFKNSNKFLFFNYFEGQIDTGNLMQALLKKAFENNIFILNNQVVENFTDLAERVEVHLKNYSFNTKKLFFATNGFAAKLTNNEVKPARAQVLITKPINNLHIKGTFHLDKGFYYFRNINNRILLGGGRNLDFEGETTTDLKTTELIQNKLKNLLETVILPEIPFEIDYCWSGIMGVGEQKKPVVKAISENVFCGVRLGGMGVAIGSLVGKELADLI